MWWRILWIWFLSMVRSDLISSRSATANFSAPPQSQPLRNVIPYNILLLPRAISSFSSFVVSSPLFHPPGLPRNQSTASSDVPAWPAWLNAYFPVRSCWRGSVENDRRCACDFQISIAHVVIIPIVLCLLGLASMSIVPLLLLRLLEEARCWNWITTGFAA